MEIWKYWKFRGSDILPEKKEYAKLAIPLTGSKGQAPAGFLKKSSFLFLNASLK
jgi:hypothetical protein